MFKIYKLYLYLKGTKFGKDIKFAKLVSKLKKKMPIETFSI